MVKAIQHLEQALDRLVGEPDATARATLARLYVRAGSYDKAIPLLIDLVNQEPGWQEGPQLLVEAYASAGCNADAIQWLEQAVEGDPRLYATLADFFERDRRWKDAAGAFAEAVKASPRNPELKRRYASALLNGGGRQAVGTARDVLTDVLAARPNDARALYLLSQAQRRLGDLTAAEATARTLIAQNVKSPWGFSALSEALEAPAVSGRCRYAVDRPRPVPIVSRERFVVRARSSAAAAPGSRTGARSVRQGDCGVRRSTSPVAEDPAVTGYLIEANLAAKKYSAAADLAHQARSQSPTTCGSRDSKPRRSGRVENPIKASPCCRTF
jgi:tetratricopeptide (TPR) repeat protein